MMVMSRDWVSSMSYCSIYIKSLPLEKLLKMQLPPLHKFKLPKLKRFVGLMANLWLYWLLLGPNNPLSEKYKRKLIHGQKNKL